MDIGLTLSFCYFVCFIQTKKGILDLYSFILNLVNVLNLVKYLGGMNGDIVSFFR